MDYQVRKALPALWKQLLPEIKNISSDTAVLEEVGARRRSGKYCKDKNYDRVLIVTDRNLIGTGLIDMVTNSLDENGIIYDIYDAVLPDPTYLMIAQAKYVGKAIGAKCVIAIGGGSVLDCAKMTACALEADKIPLSIINKLILGTLYGHKPIITIPTTAGSGAEVSNYTVVTNDKNNIKHVAGGLKLSAELALLDTEVLKNCPSEIIAYTGIEAMSQGIEAYLSDTEASEEQKDIMTKCVKLSMENLYTAYTNPDDMNAKRNMLIAANYGGRSINYAVIGYANSFANALGMVYHIPHGEAVASVLVETLRFEKDVCEEKFAELAFICGIGDSENDITENAEIFINAVEMLIKYVGLNNYCEELKPESYNYIIKRAFKDSEGYPLPKVMKKEEAMSLLKKCTDEVNVNAEDVNVEDVKAEGKACCFKIDTKKKAAIAVGSAAAGILLAYILYGNRK